MAERGSMDTRPGREGDDGGYQPWLAYAEANGMMHTFERIGRSESPSSMLGIAQHHYSEQSIADSASSMGASSSGSQSRRSAFLKSVDPAVRRRVEAAQVYFLEYYVDQLTYIANRRQRLERFKNAMRSIQVTPHSVQRSWGNHQANETNILRRRRTRTREHEFDVLAQIGQGGFGQVFLARKRDTGEVCALKKMDKQLLVRLNEVQHILTERDILRTSKSEWLVRLLYSFQDARHLYLAMEF
ncbi:serine/threonine-protein kinase dbf2, partial [Coemansia thaxteri]